MHRSDARPGRCLSRQAADPAWPDHADAGADPAGGDRHRSCRAPHRPARDAAPPGIEANTSLPPILLSAPALKIRAGKETKLVFEADNGAAPNAALASDTDRCRKRLSRLVRLSWLAPDIGRIILDGRQPATLSVEALLAAAIPLDWADQRRALGLA